MFLERGEESALLLHRAYAQAEIAGSRERGVLPLIGSLLSRWQAQKTTSQAEAGISDVLTGRERDILSQISQGLPNKQIARELQISPETVKSHIKRIFMKFAVGTRIEAVSHARALGLL